MVWRGASYPARGFAFFVLSRAKERAEPSGKDEVVKMADKENREESAAPTTGMKPEDTSVSPPLKARKFEKFVDEVPVEARSQSTF